MITVPLLFHRVLTLEAWMGGMSGAGGTGIQNTLVKNDTGPQLKFILKDTEGALIATSGLIVELFLKQYHEETHVNVGHEACSAYSIADAQYVYDLQDGDLSGTGTYFGDVRVTYPSGKKETAYQAVRFLVRDHNQ